jgi:ectoine hydroxylase-related dioxygenase (phytanoyl-CoA dioxygenase family)
MSLNDDGFVLIKNVFSIDTINSLKNKVKNTRPRAGFSKDVQFMIDIVDQDEYYQYQTDLIDDESHNQINSIVYPHVKKYLKNSVPYGNGIVVVQKPGWVGILPHIDCPYRFEKYNYETSLLGLTVFIPLDNFNIKNGSTAFIKGSHKYHFSDSKCRDRHYTDFFKENYSQIECNIGDLIIWHAKTLHSGMPNLSDQSRSGIAMSYIDQNILNELHELVNDETKKFLEEKDES